MKYIILICTLFFALKQVNAQCGLDSPEDFSNLKTGGGGCLGDDEWLRVNSTQVSSASSGSCLAFSGTTCAIAIYSETYDLDCAFCISFSIDIRRSATSDGIAFSFVNYSHTGAGAGDVCRTSHGCDEGGNIGYNRLTPANNKSSVNIEFDIFDNSSDGDADEDSGGDYCEHVAVHHNGDNSDFIGSYGHDAFSCVPGLGNNGSNDVEICWDPLTEAMEVRIDGVTHIRLDDFDMADYVGGNEVNFTISSGFNDVFFG